MSGLLKLCGAALLAVCTAFFLKDRNREFSAIVSVTACVLIFSELIGCAEQITVFLVELSGESAASSYVPVLLKAVGFSILTEISVGFCRSAGEEGIAGAIGIAGRWEILLLSLPYVKELVSIAIGLLKT